MAEVFLVGSGVSIFEPNGLPNGQKITDLIIDRLLRSVRPPHFSENEWVKTLTPLVAKAPFEQVFNKYPAAGGLKNKLAAIFGKKADGDGQTDVVHEALHELIVSRKIKTVFTTNYDTKIEDASTTYSPRVIIDKDDLKLPRKDFDLVKLHGCISRPKSIIATIEEEPVPEDWKLKLLLERIMGQSLEIFGYSGLDFDLTELILTVGARDVIWNIPSWASLSVNAAEAAKRGWVQRRAFEASLPLNQSIDLRPLIHDTHPHELDPIFEGLTSEQLTTWCIRLLQDISQAKAAIELLSTMPSISSDPLLTADLMERVGLYQQSRALLAHAYRKAGSPFEKVSILQTRAGRSYTSARPLSMIPDLIRVRVSKGKISNPRQRRITQARDTYVQFLFFKGLRKQLAMAPFLKKTVSLTRWEQKLGEAASEFARLGDRQQFNLCKIQLEEYFPEHRIAVTGISANYYFLEAAASFEHLANNVGRFAAMRKSDVADKEQAKAASKESFEAGLYPEVWKYADERWAGQKIIAVDCALRCLAACEYPGIFKIVKAVKISRSSGCGWVNTLLNVFAVQRTRRFPLQRTLSAMRWLDKKV